MFGFSSKLLLTNIVNSLSSNAFGLLLGKYYGDYQAGADMESKPAMLTFNAEGDPETTIVWDRSHDKEAE
jgi:hypothetical protein